MALTADQRLVDIESRFWNEIQIEKALPRCVTSQDLDANYYASLQ
jgi:hypothetical protein